MKQSQSAKSVPLGIYKALLIRLFRFIRMETYRSFDDKVQNSGQNRKTFDKNVLTRLDKRFLKGKTYFRKLHTTAKKRPIETVHRYG
jgi:inorganic triphosphatase YgiF